MVCRPAAGFAAGKNKHIQPFIHLLSSIWTLLRTKQIFPHKPRAAGGRLSWNSINLAGRRATHWHRGPERDTAEWEQPGTQGKRSAYRKGHSIQFFKNRFMFRSKFGYQQSKENGPNTVDIQFCHNIFLVWHVGGHSVAAAKGGHDTRLVRSSGTDFTITISDVTAWLLSNSTTLSIFCKRRCKSSPRKCLLFSLSKMYIFKIMPGHSNCLS